MSNESGNNSMSDQEVPDENQPFEDQQPLTVKPSLAAKQGMTIWRMMLVVALVACFFGFISPVYLFFDALGHGPYTTNYNQKCQKLADEAKLLGRPEADIIAILGPPTDIWDYEGDGKRMTYDYNPVPFIDAGIFQVHCKNGIVTGLEQFDD
jgi:hypothetical protein